MCRLLAYAGPPVDLASLLLAPPHSLLRQSWAPRHQAHGVVNADGFGVGWYDLATRAEPALYRSAQPMWADANLASLAPMIRSGAVLAAVRSATPPSPVSDDNSPPFADGRWLFAHNGAVDGFPQSLGRLRRGLSDERLAGLRGGTDSEVLFGLALDRLDAGASAADALRGVVEAVTSTAGGGRLNMVLLDGTTVTAAACGESLFVRSGAGVVLASEPFDDHEGWEPVPDQSLVEATAESVRVGGL
ncbi:MAG: gamma-glutamyl hercynylcysteine S-oxide hydrolase [Acidimicrobiaceae bacterium]|nr:gamma-glutamyl hercynylcysteine S-oxide hydrolase [Acidimicrobiaceae bacterium]